MKLTKTRKEAFRTAYKMGWKVDPSQCYSLWSSDKQKAYEEQKRLWDILGGFDLRIISLTMHSFSVVFLYIHPLTNNIMLHIGTYKNNYDFEL